MSSKMTPRHKSVPEKHRAEALATLRAAVITVSDHRFDLLWSKGKTIQELEDKSGEKAMTLLEQAGHQVVFRTLLPDHTGMVSSTIDHIVDYYDVDMIITLGSTGISPRDIVVEAMRSIVDKELEGFGELFRRLSYDRQKDLGAASILSRATAGVFKGTLIFCLPGSPQAVDTGMRIILQEIGHMVSVARQSQETT